MAKGSCSIRAHLAARPIPRAAGPGGKISWAHFLDWPDPRGIPREKSHVSGGQENFLVSLVCRSDDSPLANEGRRLAAAPLDIAAAGPSPRKMTICHSYGVVSIKCHSI